jgi:hypothetical protein
MSLSWLDRYFISEPTPIDYEIPTDANQTLPPDVYDQVQPLVTVHITSAVTLTATRDLTIPLTVRNVFAVRNDTTGGQSIRVIGKTGTGITIASGKTAQVVADGTNIVLAQADSASSVAVSGAAGAVVVANGAGAISGTAAPVVAADDGSGGIILKSALTKTARLAGDNNGSSYLEAQGGGGVTAHADGSDLVLEASGGAAALTADGDDVTVSATGGGSVALQATSSGGAVSATAAENVTLTAGTDDAGAQVSAGVQGGTFLTLLQASMTFGSFVVNATNVDAGARGILTTGYIGLGSVSTPRADAGLIRLNYTTQTVIAIRNNSDTGNWNGLKHAAAQWTLGDVNMNLQLDAYATNYNATTSHTCGIGAGYAWVATSASVAFGKPIVGHTTSSSPYGVHGRAKVTPASDADDSLVAAEYAMFVIAVQGGVWTAAHKMSGLPHPASETASYTKLLVAEPTHDTTFSTGTGHELLVPGGGAVLASITPDGVDPAEY